MDINQPIIIPEINSSNAICDYLYQTSKVLSDKHYPVYVFFVNYPHKIYQSPFKTITPCLTHCYPLQIIPFNRFKIVEKLNIFLSFNLLHLYILFRHHSRPLYWFFYPQVVALIKYSLAPSRILYDIVDSYNCPQFLKKDLLDRADIVTAISQNLISEYQTISPRIKINLVPQGFNLLQSTSEPFPLAKLHHLKNKVGFIGGLNNRLDYNLLFAIIKNNPQYSFIFAGPAGHDTNVTDKPVEKLNAKLFSFKNVYSIGLVKKDQIESVINFFDIAIIPYDIRDQFNLLCYPMKIFEYFACQKPTISTPIEELKHFPDLIKIGNTPQEWQEHLEFFFAHPLSKKLKSKALKLAQKNSWQNKIKQILKFF